MGRYFECQCFPSVLDPKVSQIFEAINHHPYINRIITIEFIGGCVPESD